MLIALLLERGETQDLAWQYVQQHWAEISRKATVNVGVADGGGDGGRSARWRSGMR